ncbi:MAG: flagellar motor switch protein FliN [Pontibacterium sp.]
MSDEDLDQQALADEWAAAMSEQGDAEEAAAEAAGAAEAVSLNSLVDESVPVTDPKLDFIQDVSVTLSMEVGETQIPIRNLLQLNQGSVIELDRVAGEPLDVKVNGTLIAHGEVVVVNERYALRLTDVVSPQERINRLK